jgi:DNA-binding CsgD family transcriptional regulator/tetratricopeptide (TPR) repeat protein
VVAAVARAPDVPYGRGAGVAVAVTAATDPRETDRELSDGRGIFSAMTASASSPLLVGREAELARLRDALKRARGREPSAVLIGGEAGVGKTRLVGEFIVGATADGAQVLSGQCLELGEEGLPFAPFAAALRDLLRRDGPAAFAGHEQDFARLLPELAPAAPEALSEAHRGYLFDLVAGLFARLAGDRPLVLVIEDLHWADRSTRDLIAYLVRSARTAPVLLVGTYRSDELHRGHPLRPFLAELDRVRGVERLDVDRLDREGTAEILQQILGAEPLPALVDNIFDRAQGNPFFVEELAVCTDPQVCADLPDSLRDLLLSRVDRLDEATQRVLRIFAAGGNKVGHELLAEVAAVPDRELEAALRSAVAAQLVLADPDGGYEFRHALVREAVHDDLLPGEHARLHARYAAAIEARPDVVSAGRAAIEVAHHWHAAHDHPRALTAAVAAAAAAGRRYAFAEKSRLLERALKLWEQVPDAAERLGMDHLDLLEANVSAASEAGDHMRAMTLTRAALAEVDEQREPLRAARLLALRGKLMRTLGKASGLTELSHAYELASKVDNSPERARMLADLAASLAPVDVAQSRRVAGEALESAKDLGEEAIQISAAVTLGFACSLDQQAEQGLAETTEAAAWAERAGDSTALVRALISISHQLFTLGRYEESAEAAHRGLGTARRVGISRTTGAFLLVNAGEALMALGRWDEADALFAELARLDPPGTLAAPGLALRAHLRLARAHPAANDLVGRAVGFLAKPYLEGHMRVPLHALRVTAALVAEDAPAALSAAGAGLADPDLRADPRYAWPLLAAAACAVRLGRATGEARVEESFDGVRQSSATVPLDELADRILCEAAVLPARYPAERAYAAEVAALRSGDVEAWRAAVAAWRVDGQPYPLGCALLSLAETAAAAGDRATVAEAVGEAGEIAGSLDAAVLRDTVETLARRVGLRAAGRAVAVGPGAEPLTSREVEVLRLVAEGHSNRRIAEALYISPKTASVHVSRIIAKLEVANRVEAAAVAHRLGLL